MSSGKYIEFTLPEGTKILGKEDFMERIGITHYRLSLHLRRGGSFFDHEGQRYYYKKILKLMRPRDYIPNPLGRPKMGRPVTKVKRIVHKGDDYRFSGCFVMRYASDGTLSKTYHRERFELYLNTLLKFIL
jgi:hypothetical protein